MKALVHGRQFEAILNEQYLPPVVVNLDVSGACQYRCPHCHHRQKQIKSRKMPMLDDRLARTFPGFLANWEIDCIKPRACCIVGSQGDALTWPGLSKLLKDLHFNTIDVGLVSNGYGYDAQTLSYAAHYCKFVGFSMDAGTKETYDLVHCPPKDGWDTVIGNIEHLTRILNVSGLRNDVGFKFLILPQSWHTLYDACKLAKELGCRYVQIRPADLKPEDLEIIDIDKVNEMIERAIDDFDEPGVFEIAGVRHKFKPDFTRVLPEYCWLTALTVTITSDGMAWPCVDRRWDEPTLLANCMEGGWAALRDAWGSARHIQIIHDVINRGGEGPDCNIRCSNYGYDKLFKRVFYNDDMDRLLI
jgi:MoaA/NifB/PqqE/SkfB family radical SAM enzyme